MTTWLYSLIPARLALFLCILPRAPRRALDVGWCYLTGRRVRAVNRLRAAAAVVLDPYSAWIRAVEWPRDRLYIRSLRQESAERSISVVVHASGPCSNALRATCLSLAAAMAKPREILIATGYRPSVDHELELALRTSGIAWKGLARPGDASGAVFEALTMATGELIVLVCAGTVVAPSALARLADAAAIRPDAVLLYGDEDRMDADGRRFQPWFKPRWNMEMALAQDFFSHLFAMSAAVRPEAPCGPPCSSEDAVHALFLHTALSSDSPIIHVPFVLSHRSSAAASGAVGEEASLSLPAAKVPTIRALLAAQGATVRPGAFGTARVEWPLPVPLPHVTVIVPTRDRLEILKVCIESIVDKTEYSAYDVLIVDNDSKEPKTLDWLAHISKLTNVSVFHYSGEFNYSAINNYASKCTRADFYCFLNNDTEVIDGSWLTELMRYAVRPGIGAVGAKLLYPDRTIQHAGVVIGVGDAAGHAHRGLPEGDPGYFAMAHTAQYVSSVTGACLMVASRKFWHVGGLDEANLKVAYNDVDFCLKLEEAGWRNVYTPHAVLIHHESKSRRNDMSADQIDRYRAELKFFQDRWGTRDAIDPSHHPQLDRTSEIFRIGL